MKSTHATIISGIRRCGKSTLLLHLINQVKQSHYFNFEDSRVASFEISDFEKLENIFAEEKKLPTISFSMRFRTLNIMKNLSVIFSIKRKRFSLQALTHHC
jgi:AAA+ ATPase superfamily predicted ATPase